MTDESRGRLYDLIVVGYPKELPVGYDIRSDYGKVAARFAGYFLKLQGYESGLAKPGQRPEKAPLLIGRLEWTPTTAPPADNSPELTWAAVLLGIAGLAFLVWLVLFRPKRPMPPAPPRVVDPSSGEAIPLDAWLEQQDFAGDGDHDATPRF